MHFTVVADLGEMSCLAAITSLSGIKICSAITLEIPKLFTIFFTIFLRHKSQEHFASNFATDLPWDFVAMNSS